MAERRNPKTKPPKSTTNTRIKHPTPTGSQSINNFSFVDRAPFFRKNGCNQTRSKNCELSHKRQRPKHSTTNHQAWI